MGPYMSPIPANASAAMIFSFFVAVIVTPWLMLGSPGRRRPAHHADDAPRRLRSGRLYAAVARPLLRHASSRAWLFLLIVVGARHFGSLALFYTRDVTVKLLPFDNKSELASGDRPARRHVRRGDRRAWRKRAAAYRAGDLPEVRSRPDLCRHRRAVQLQRPRAPLLPARRTPSMGDVQVNLERQARPRPARATRSPWTCASG